MKRNLHPIAGAVAMLCALASNAWADGGPDFKFSGFGTVGVAHSSEDQADFTAVADQPSGAGYTRKWDFNPDTKLGGQADVKFNSQFSATAQAVVRQRYDNSETPELMMAFGKWQAVPSVAVRVGRLAVPAFLISDYRNVSYSQPTARPPVDMYHAFSFYHYDGADATWTQNFGDIALKTQGFLGKLNVKQPSDITIDMKRLGGANVTAEIGDMTFRVSYLGTTSVTFSSPTLDGTFLGVRFGFPAGALGPGAPAIPGSPALADQYELKDKNASYTSLGFNYDPGKWFVTSELGFAKLQGGFVPDQTFAYVIGGMRIDKFTPYAVLSTVKVDIAGSTTGHPVVDAIRTSSAAIGQSTLSAGLRWDAIKNVAVKTQLDHVYLRNDSAGQLTNTQPGFKPGGSYNVFSVAVDFVF